MKTKSLSVLILWALMFSALMPFSAQAKAPERAVSPKGVSPEGMLNPDGTLNLSGNFSGALDLASYSVQLDPKRGPVFNPSGNVKSAVTPGDWAGVGDGGGAITERVKGIAVSGSNVYVVGSITDVGNIPEADYVAKWDGTNWSALGSNGAGNGAIDFYTNAVAVSGGNVYVGGSFSHVYNGAVQNNTAAKIAKWDGSTWSGLGSDGAGGGSLNNDVYAIAVDGSGNVYAGGSFTDVKNGLTTLPEADYVAKWDGTNWSALGNNGAGTGALGSGVNAIAVSGTNVYVGGYFTDAGGVLAADYVAKWNGSTWSALGSNGPAGNGSITGGYVNALAVSGTDVYVGGSFVDINNNGTVLNTADFVAKWNGTTWSALGSNGGNGALNYYVNSILVSGTDVYVGGKFTDAAGLGEADTIAKWDGTNWNALGNNGAGNGAIPNKSDPIVMALAMQGSNLLAGGWFYDVNDGSTPQLQADYLAQWNGIHWSSVGSVANGALVNGYASSRVEVITVSGTDVYVGGNFTNISNHGVNIPEGDAVVKWDGTNWSALGSNGAGEGAISGTVYALAVSGTDLYVGGGFTNAAGSPEADYIAKWDGTNWSALGNNGAGVGALPASGSVYDLAVSGTDLYAGGSFTNAAGIAEADYIARWNGTNWSALGNNGAGVGALNNYVSGLAIDGTGNVYAGGAFINAAGIAEADMIAKWDGTNWSALGNNGAGDGALGDTVITLTVDGTNLYVGGLFTNAANLSAADYIAKWDGTNWSALGSNGPGSDGSLNQLVKSIVVKGTDVFAGGWFTNVNSSGTVLPSADYVARWNGTAWSALGNNGANNGSLPSNVYSLGLLGTDLIVGGTFSNISNNGVMVPEADYLAAYGIPPYTPATRTVTKLADTNDGVCDADCSLREAISAAKDTDSIIFAGGLSGTITLGSPLSIGKDITISGPPASAISISGNDAVRILTIQAGAGVQLSNLTLTHGYVLDQNGGAIFNDGGNLVLDHAIISNSQAVSTNSSYGNGGGIYSSNHGKLTLTGSCQITANTASFSGGGIYAAVDSGATFSMSNTTVDHNTASLGDGGGIYLPNPGAGAPGSIDIFASAITDNLVSGGGGGGIYLAASADITRSIIANNSMSAFSKGGGGLKIHEGGAGFKPITVSVTNVTISGNNALGQGGGVEVSLQQAADAVTFNNVTIAGNHRNVLPGPPAVNGGGGIFASGTDLPDLLNSIVAANTSGVGGADCEGTLNSLDYNLIQDTTNCTLNGTTTHNLTGVSASLGPLADHGGGTQTMALLWGSPAINAGNDLTCSLQDQRGNPRPKGTHCDLGAYELQQAKGTYLSTAAQDGWVLESGKNTKVGGTMDSASTTFRLGDDAANKQYRGILSFNTAGLPDNAVITKVTLKVKKSGITGGGNPITMFQGFMADIKKGTFGTAALQITDFQALGKTYGPFTPTGTWYALDLSAAKAYINKLTTGSGLTQIRLRFKLNNNNNSIANHLSLFSGNAPAASRPQLIIEYYVP